MGARMCERVKAAVDMLQEQKRALTKGEIVMVFRKVIDDLEQQGQKMGDRMTRLEEKVTSLENKVDAGFAEIKALLESNKRKSLIDIIIELQGHKWFWLSLIVILLILAGLLGVPLSGFNGILTINGG